MATRERVETDVLCDRPGCGRRVTDKGGIMVIHASEHDTVADVMFIGCSAPTPPGTYVDLCRECLQQMGNAWNRKADGE